MWLASFTSQPAYFLGKKIPLYQSKRRSCVPRTRPLGSGEDKNVLPRLESNRNFPVTQGNSVPNVVWMRTYVTFTRSSNDVQNGEWFSVRRCFFPTGGHENCLPPSPWTPCGAWPRKVTFNSFWPFLAVSHSFSSLVCTWNCLFSVPRV